MNTEIINIDDLETQQQVDGVANHLVHVVLEGKDDLRLFRDFWFGIYREQFEFLTPSAHGGGCTAVQKKVTELRGKSIPAFGVVDRDVLARLEKWELMYSTRPSEIKDASVLGPEIEILERWEIEAYLLEGNALYEYVQHNGRTAPEPPARDLMVFLSLILKHCDGLLAISGVKAVSHALGKSLGDLGLYGEPEHLIGQVNRFYKLHISEDQRYEPEKHDSLRNRIDEIAKSTCAGVDDIEQRLALLLCIVDTKLLLSRIGFAFGLKMDGGEPIWKWGLADKLRDRGHCPEEIKRILF